MPSPMRPYGLNDTVHWAARTLAAVGLLAAVGVHAEPPMVTDDAGALEKGGAKVEVQWARDGKELRSAGLGLGYGLAEGLEVGVSFGRGRDNSTSPVTTLNATGIVFKWVPWHLGEQSSFGVKLDYGVERVSGGGGRVSGTQVTGLASHVLDSGVKLHANLGRAWARADGGVRGAANFWSLGVDVPVLGDSVQLVGDVYGEQHGPTGRQIGLRWRPMPGASLSAAVGRLDGQTQVVTVGAYEF